MIPEDLVQVVADDLIYLRENVRGDISPSFERHASIVLRRLIVDQHLYKALCRAEPNAPRTVALPGLDLARLQAIGGIDSIVVAFPGRAKIGGIDIIGMYNFHPSPLQGLLRVESRRWTQLSFDVRLNEIHAHPAIIACGGEITYRQLINYVANKLGGAHFDTKRHGGDDDLAFRRLDATHGLAMNDKPATLLAILGLAQALVNTPFLVTFAQAYAPSWNPERDRILAQQAVEGPREYYLDLPGAKAARKHATPLKRAIPSGRKKG